MDVIPTGACEVKIAQKKRSNNILALRRTFSTMYFLNANWIVQKSGNYTYKDDSFFYTSPEQLDKDTNATEEIQFSSQLSQAIDACLIRSGSSWAFFNPPFSEHS